MAIRREKIIVLLMATAFVVVVTLFAWLKYAHFGYNGLDLAIYNQTFWNTVHGRWFSLSIHPPSYLGDHAEWLILALAPFYALWQQPLTLVFLQTLALALSAIPVWLIAKSKFAAWHCRLLSVFIWLANPFTWNLALFEFHLIVFVIPFAFGAAYFYLQKRWPPYLAMLLGILLVREDMAFVVFGFALVGFIDLLAHRLARREIIKWIVIPAIMALVTFVINQKVIAHFNPDGVYKYLIYYQWLGNSPLQIIGNGLSHPLKLLLHLLKTENLEVLTALLLPTLFFALFRPRWLLLASVVLAQHLVSLNGAETAILRTQYSAPFLPAIILASLEGLEKILAGKSLARKIMPQPLIPFLLALACVYSWFALGPGLGSLAAFKPTAARTKALSAAVALIPADAPVVASIDTITQLSSRRFVWPLNYVWLGKKQFATSDYILPVAPEYLILDERDFLYFTVRYPLIDWTAPYYATGAARLRELIATGNYGTIFEKSGIAVLKKDQGGDWPFVRRLAAATKIDHPANQETNGVVFLGWTSDDRLRLFFTVKEKIASELALTVNGKVEALGNGLYPTTAWQPGETIEIALDPSGSSKKIFIAQVAGGLDMDSLGALFLTFDQIKQLGQPIVIP